MKSSRYDYIKISKIIKKLYLLGVEQQLLPPVGLLRFRVLPGQIFGDLAGGELGFAHVPKVPRQMDGFALHQRGEQRHVGRLAASGRQVQADLLQLFPQQSAAVFTFRSGWGEKRENSY